jgi:tetratricopeptide (TPR) repeat protein
MKTAAGSPLILGTSLLLACGGEEPPSISESPEQGVARAVPDGAEALSFLGEALFRPEYPADVLSQRQDQMEEALTNLEAAPSDPDALIWAGRRAAYLGEYRRAIEFFTLGTQSYPDDPRFFRHRGHRYITVREMDNAIADFAQAAKLIEGTEDQVEPDGQPNARGIPTSTLQFNIWYHYGLAHYLKGEFDQAVEKYRECMEVSAHADSKVATAHWWYMALRRIGMDEEARELVQGMELDALGAEIIESGSYLDLLRLYARGSAGEVVGSDPQDQDQAASGYGYGNWQLYNGDEAGAREIFESMVEARNQWGAFGYIAAEAELARMQDRR